MFYPKSKMLYHQKPDIYKPQVHPIPVNNQKSAIIINVHLIHFPYTGHN